MRVRAAGVEDVPAAARVHHEASVAAYAEIPNASTLAGRQTLWQAVVTNPDRCAYVVEVDEEIVGVLIIGPSGNGETGELFVIYVNPRWWGTGAGQRLIEHADERLAEHFQEAELTVLASNARARRFYERNGWDLAEIKVEPHFGGVPTEVAIYCKNFG